MRTSSNIPLLLIALLLLSSSGCAYSFKRYQAVSRPLTHGRTVKISIDNPDARFKREGVLGHPSAKTSSPTLAKYIKAALVKEFRAAGFVVADRGPYDVVLRVRIRDVIGAHIVGFWFYPLTIGWTRQAGVVDLSVTARLPATRRIFQRRFAKSFKDSTFWFFVPFGWTSSNDMVHKATQGCLAELVKGVVDLLKDPDGQG